MVKRRFSLKAIYLAVLTAVFSLSSVAFVLFDMNSQQQQTEAALLEEARTFAREMDAVWTFMDNSQDVINSTSDGAYEFKGLHCAVVGKSVGRLFSVGSDYAIRYTNFNPRSEQDIPDEFESIALKAFNENPAITEQYGIVDVDGQERFRYARALEVNESCLECHGSPKGEIDITGHAKEGWELGGVGGAISIIIPIDQQRQAQMDNLAHDIVFFVMLMVLIGGVVYLATKKFVLHPLNGLAGAFDEMRGGRMDASPDKGDAALEIAGLIDDFDGMAGELRGMYEHLESQVSVRTEELWRANELLEQQRDSLEDLNGELRAANELLEQQRDSLEDLNGELEKETRFKSDMLSMVNHELRTPLTSIITFAQVSREACGPERERDRKAWDHIEKNSQILLTMINDMLDIARSDAGTVHVAREAMDLGDVLAAVRSTMAPLASRYEVDLTTSAAPDVPLVLGDYEKTMRMVENLASNAIKFTPDGGSVSVQVSFDREARNVTIAVSDTGIGIAEEDQERIFERFVQVDSTSTRKYAGSGLGLALVREYADLQGFTVAVESRLGQGSVFVITVPKESIVGEI